MNNFGLSEDKLALLLQMAGKKLGQDPAELKQKLESGALDDLTKNLDPKAAKQVGSLLQNPQAAEMLLQNDKVKNMLAGLLGKQK